MESCRLPIELCEAVMDELPYRYDTSQPGWSTAFSTTPSLRALCALCACSLTCRAWRVRAQRLLWVSPCFLDQRDIALFTKGLRTAPTSLVTALMFDRGGHDKSGELFMHTFPNLRLLSYRYVSFECCGPPVAFFRMRLPFFTSVTVLTLVNCDFISWRAMLDVIWAFPNLASLKLDLVLPRLRTVARNIDLATVCEHRQACRKLTELNICTLPLERLPHSQLITGKVFGCAITRMVLGTFHSTNLSYFMTNAFPSLRSIVVRVDVQGPPPHISHAEYGHPYLHVIAASRPVPGVLKSVVLEYPHYQGSRECCEVAIGTSEEVHEYAQRLPELLYGLEELAFRSPARVDSYLGTHICLAYIRSVLPSLLNVLRFEGYECPGAMQTEIST